MIAKSTQEKSVATVTHPNPNPNSPNCATVLVHIEIPKLTSARENPNSNTNTNNNCISPSPLAKGCGRTRSGRRGGHCAVRTLSHSGGASSSATLGVRRSCAVCPNSTLLLCYRYSTVEYSTGTCDTVRSAYSSSRLSPLDGEVDICICFYLDEQLPVPVGCFSVPSSPRPPRDIRNFISLTDPHSTQNSLPPTLPPTFAPTTVPLGVGISGLMIMLPSRFFLSFFFLFFLLFSFHKEPQSLGFSPCVCLRDSRIPPPQSLPESQTTCGMLHPSVRVPSRRVEYYLPPAGWGSV